MEMLLQRYSTFFSHSNFKKMFPMLTSAIIDGIQVIIGLKTVSYKLQHVSMLCKVNFKTQSFNVPTVKLD